MLLGMLQLYDEEILHVAAMVMKGTAGACGVTSLVEADI
jgi:hypothetical protein